MTPADPGDDDELASVLSACDEALAGGDTSAISDGNGIPADQARLLKNLDCVRLLRQVWPRHDATEPTTSNGLSPPVPERLGRFRIDRELGRGGFGIVYLAFDPQLARTVALKVPRSDVLSTPQLRERFRHEARAAAALDHPNIVGVHETGEIESVAYIAASYCRGVTLAKWMDERPDGVPFPLATSLVAQLADGVEHAHRRDVLHRDLKPSNVMLVFPDGDGQSDPVPKITDFGLARTLGDVDSSLTATGAILGTPNYLAPEQASGKNVAIGPPVDVYGLGTILYELLTRRPPFVSDNALETLRQVRFDDPIPPRKLRAQVPRDLETICLKCLEKEQAHRYKSAADLAADLRRFAAGEPILARPLGVAGRSLKWTRRHPTATVLFASTLLATIGISLGATWFSQDRQARRVRAEADVNAVLQETISLYGQAEGAGRNPSLWADALAAAKRADAIAAVGDTPPELRSQVTLLLAEIERREKNHRLIATLADIQASMGDELMANSDQDFPTANTRYARAFADYGLDLYLVAPEQSAEVLRGLGDGSSLPVAEALDNWGYVRMVMGQPNPKQLHRVSRLLDPDPIRNRIRAAVIADDRTALLQLTDDIDPAVQPPQTVNFLAVIRFWKARSRYYADEIEFLQRAQFHHPNDFQINHNLAYALHMVGRADEAVPFARIAVALRPNSAAAWQDLANSLKLSNRDGEALDALRRLTALAPKVVSHWHWMAEIYERQGMPDEAAAAYRQACRLVPKYDPRDASFIQHWKKYGLLDDAVAEYRKVIAGEPENIRARLGLAVVLFNQEKWGEMVAEYDAVVALEPAYPGHYAERGNARAKVVELTGGDWKAVAADFARATELNSGEHGVWYRDALMQLVLGHPDRYRAICAAMLNRFGDRKESFPVNGVVWTCALVPGAVDDPERQVRMAQRVFEREPTVRPYANTYGVALFRAGQFDAARKQFLLSLQGSERHFDAYDWLFLAMTDAKLGEPERAREWFDKAAKYFDYPGADAKTKWNWDDRLEQALLRKEAAELLKSPREKASAGDPK